MITPTHTLWLVSPLATTFTDHISLAGWSSWPVWKKSKNQWSFHSAKTKKPNTFTIFLLLTSQSLLSGSYRRQNYHFSRVLQQLGGMLKPWTQSSLPLQFLVFLHELHCCFSSYMRKKVLFLSSVHWCMPAAPQNRNSWDVTWRHSICTKAFHFIRQKCIHITWVYTLFCTFRKMTGYLPLPSSVFDLICQKSHKKIVGWKHSYN